ncbi:MAG: threonine aldolase [Frankiaceae bacterium]|nr:threonine aldolase [Frankiaceae bacterium]
MADDVTSETPGRLHDPGSRGFASDNYAGVHPEILAALAVANGGHLGSYGADPYTAAAEAAFRAHFGEQAETFFVFNGTGANVVSLQAMTQRWDAVICAETAHINVDECGAPEKVAGLKLLPVATPDGKLTPALIDVHAWGFGDQHHAQPRVVSVTQTTELGTLYTPDEIAAISAHAHELGMLVHLDGARIANAAAALDLPLRAFTTDVGVDVLSFGGTKNGLMYGEAVVVLDPAAVRGIPFLRKAAMQLSSKMRFVGVQFETLLGTDLWLRSALHANAMAARLAAAMADVPGLRISRPSQANAVFAVLPADVTARLQKRFQFYVWDEHTGEVRWMCSFDTTADDIDAFAAAVRAELAP